MPRIVRHTPTRLCYLRLPLDEPPLRNEPELPELELERDDDDDELVPPLRNEPELPLKFDERLDDELDER